MPINTFTPNEEYMTQYSDLSDPIKRASWFTNDKYKHIREAIMKGHIQIYGSKDNQTSRGEGYPLIGMCYDIVSKICSHHALKTKGDILDKKAIGLGHRDHELIQTSEFCASSTPDKTFCAYRVINVHNKLAGKLGSTIKGVSVTSDYVKEDYNDKIILAIYDTFTVLVALSTLVKNAVNLITDAKKSISADPGGNNTFNDDTCRENYGVNMKQLNFIINITETLTRQNDVKDKGFFIDFMKKYQNYPDVFSVLTVSDDSLVNKTLLFWNELGNHSNLKSIMETLNLITPVPVIESSNVSIVDNTNGDNAEAVTAKEVTVDAGTATAVPAEDARTKLNNIDSALRGFGTAVAHNSMLFQQILKIKSHSINSYIGRFENLGINNMLTKGYDGINPITGTKLSNREKPYLLPIYHSMVALVLQILSFQKASDNGFFPYIRDSKNTARGTTFAKGMIFGKKEPEKSTLTTTARVKPVTGDPFKIGGKRKRTQKKKKNKKRTKRTRRR